MQRDNCMRSLSFNAMETHNMFAIFENDGTLDQSAIMTFGVNAKPNSVNPIGFFGTGLKYAIAVGARLKLPMFIQFGDGSMWHVVTCTDKFRDADVEFVELVEMYASDPINKRLPFTTALGKNWEMWQMLRELESNVRDENGHSNLSSTIPPPCVGKVRVIVGGTFADNYNDMMRTTFFNPDGRAAQNTVYGQVLDEPAMIVYYRGIRVSMLPKPTQFTYNITASLTLTEDRTVKDNWAMVGNIGAMLLQLRDERMIEKFLRCHSREFSFEAGLDPYYPSAHDEFKVVANRMYDDPRVIMQPSVYGYIDKERKEKRRPRKVNTDTKHDRALQKAIASCHRMGFAVDSYPIVLTDELPANQWGMAKDDTIYVNISVFEFGHETLIGTLIEEFAHLKYGMADETRQFQDWLLRQIVRVGTARRR